VRILMVAPEPFFRPRGTPFSVLHRVRALLGLGHSVDLVTYPFGESPELPGLTIRRAGRPPGVRDVPIGPSLRKLLLDAPLFATAYEMARTGTYDLIHTHEEAGAMGGWIARGCGLPHLYDMHSSLPQQFANFGRFNWPPVVATFQALERYTLERADGVIAICPELRDHVLELGYGRPLAVIENTLDFDAPCFGASDVESLREAMGLSSARVVLYTGTFEPYQGLDLLVDAAPRVLQREPGVRFVLLGGTAEQIERLSRHTEARGVAGSFHLLPAVPPGDVFLYQRMADVLVTTRARGTNTPLKIYQYLRAGRPIVATEIRSHTQVLDRDTAELVPATADDVAGGLIRVLAHPAYARRLADAAAALAEERYSDDIYYGRLSELLDQVLSRGARRSA
jgi:glycosyltransferase involved in cell wall biosynthesis